MYRRNHRDLLKINETFHKDSKVADSDVETSDKTPRVKESEHANVPRSESKPSHYRNRYGR